MENVEIKKKICLLGSYGVGKTSMVRQFVYNKFEEKYLSTIGVHISKKLIHVNSTKSSELNLFIWDIANIEKFDSVVNNYMRGAHGAIIVADVTRLNTVESMNEFAENFLRINPNSKLVFVINKFDLSTQTNFSEEEYLNKINHNKVELFFTSAKTGENIEEVFKVLSEKMIKSN